MSRKLALIAALAGGVVFGVGCAGVPKNGDLALVQTNSVQPRAGNVYLLRGWIGVFSRGVDDLGDKLQQEGVRSVVFQADQWSEVAKAIEAKYGNVPASAPTREPLVLVGHSYGADNVVRIARELRNKNILVDLMVTLDPVTPPSVPTNVARTVNIYQSNGVADTLPFLRGIPLSPEKDTVRLVNMNVRTERKDLLADGHVDHFNIEKKPLIHKEVIRQVETVCLPRWQWVSLRNGQNGATGGALLASGTIPASSTSLRGQQMPMQPVSANGQTHSVSSKAVGYGGAVKNASDPWSKGGQ